MRNIKVAGDFKVPKKLISLGRYTNQDILQTKVAFNIQAVEKERRVCLQSPGVNVPTILYYC